MTKKTIIIQSIENALKKADNSIYWKLGTNEGNMTCFEEKIISQLAVGGSYEVEVVESQGQGGQQYKNIRDVYGAVDFDQQPKPEKVKAQIVGEQPTHIQPISAENYVKPATTRSPAEMTAAMIIEQAVAMREQDEKKSELNVYAEIVYNAYHDIIEKL